MKLILKTGIALTATAIASQALAHPGHEHEIGMAHVLTSPEHIEGFLFIGMIAGIIMLVRRVWAIMIGNIALMAYIFAQGASHASHGSALFGLETGLAGAALALGAWRATHIAYRSIEARRARARS
ncbi:MAG: HupE/UreJ family protein [Candidatus Phaeomarinobacter sp.]